MELTSTFSVSTNLMRSARRLSRFTLVLAGLILLFVPVQYFVVEAASIPAPYGMTAQLAGLEWTLEQRALAALVGFLPAVAIAFAQLAHHSFESSQAHHSGCLFLIEWNSHQCKYCLFQ